VAEVGLEAEFWWEFGEAVLDVHLDAVVFAATLIWWLEGSAIGRAGEGHQFIETVAQTAEAAAGAIDCTVGPACLAAVIIGLADDLLWDFHHPVENVADRPAKLAGLGVLGGGWCVDIGGDHAAQGDHGGSDDEEFFHAGEMLGSWMWGWQWFFGGNDSEILIIPA
jgi:hypothetical protein